MGKLTRRRLQQLLAYDPVTGTFTWRVTRRGKARIGSVAGTDDGRGYIKICVDGHTYRAHRIAFLYMTGRWPRHDADHVNCVKSDNRWGNLREATRTQNRANTVVRSDNTSGYKGVTRNKNKWRAQVMKDGRRLYLGLFDRPENAALAYVFAARDCFGEYARSA